MFIAGLFCLDQRFLLCGYSAFNRTHPVPCYINTVLGDAKNCHTLPDPKSQKPAITRAPGHFLLDGAGQCRTPHHSHSIINEQVNVRKNGASGEEISIRP